MPKDNEAPVEVIQGEARARLQAMADENSVELAYGAFQHRTATMITDVRKLLAYQSEAPAQGMSGDLHAILAGAHKVATGQVNDNGYEIKQRLDTVHRILEQALSRPLADREAIARDLCNAAEPRLIAGQEDAPGFDESTANVQEYWLAIADAILALSGSIPPSPAGEGKDWLADIEIRASNAEALWKEAGSTGPDKCDRVPGSMQYGAMMAFQRLAKDMRSTSPDTPPTPAPVRGE